MRARRLANIVFSLIVVAALVLGTGGLNTSNQVAAQGGPIAPDPTKIPHYFGPYPNWANSPQVLADALVSFSGGTMLPGGTPPEAVATVDPRTGGISAVTVTYPGNGYLTPPDVTIYAAGVTPTLQATAVATISLGVITNIQVDETGFGFTAPTVTLDGGTPEITATAVVSGYVDNLTLTDGGTDYVHPIVSISLPDLPGGDPATAIAVVGASGTPLSGTITSIQIVNPGAGYSHAPTVSIADAGALRPSWASGIRRQASSSGKSPKYSTPAVVEATIGVGAINVTNGGQGYDTAPTVTIADTVGTPDKYASATAHVSILGAVTAISVTNPGAGYLTPGIKKFVDTLPGLGPTAANNLGNYIPVAVPDTTTYPGTDYYEIGLVQYRHQFHSNLPASLMRGYVQLSTNVITGSHVALSNASLNPGGAATPILLPNGSQAYGVDVPHYLGPTIVATKDRPVRILFRNLLPTGSGGDLFLPVDTTLMGAGPGPDRMLLDPSGVPLEMSMDLGTVDDEVRNPACGETPKPRTCYSENRATLHLHGGLTPWISDGTPHQWTSPAGENTAYPKGVSVANVPDMPDPGPGAITFFYTNQQSARLLFYHDHAWGITRLNVYAGEAAGYLITDQAEQNLFVDNNPDPGINTAPFQDLGLGTPLIIQDKTFVPSAAKIAEQDPTWDATRWGGEGNLWFHHVYMPAQNPGDPSGMSAYGRWMYGPWFWPPAKTAKYQPIANPYYDPACDLNNPATWQYPIDPFCEPPLIPGTPNLSTGMEQFNDTPLVNGAAYPTTTVDPKAYRFRILNAANDRFFNLSLYVADPRTGTLSEVALNQSELDAAQTDPVVFPTPDTNWSKPGPNWIQIATEGGFLPAPVVVPAHPITWITDPTRFDVGNVDQHSLLLAPAERVDVIVDFSQFRGKTLILYNDAPAAFPARVPGYDYYTGGPDMSPAGAPTTLPGYGPNTRTVMQIKVSNAAPSVAFDRPNTTNDRLGQLEAAFAHHADGSGVFESSQNPIIVGQAAYNSAYGTDFVSSGWCNSPTNPSPRCDGYARIAEGSQPTDLFGFNTVAAPTSKMQIAFQPKGIHDEMNSASFDEFGRMTANLGLEAPGATPLTQNIILYPYVNPSTEIFNASGLPSSLKVTPIMTSTDGTQIWKITHNGVDTHPIHFHLYDIQVINRVTWDNIIIPPDPTELGWKDTVRVSPLEDTIVAMRPVVPALPFAVPNSIRPLNPMMPIGARGNQNGINGNQAGFNNTDAAGNPIAPIVNQLVDFAWEYVWHCHILTHEEMDMMRPQSFVVPYTRPLTPTLLTSVATAPISSTPQVALTWTDPTPANITTTLGNPRNEIGFRIERATGTSASAVWVVVTTTLANQTAFVDTSVGSGTTYRYRIVAFNIAGSATSNIRTVVTPSGPKPAAPTALTAAMMSGTQARLTWTDNSTIETGFVVERSVNGGAYTNLATVGPRSSTGSVTYNDNTVVAANTYSYRVRAINGAISSGYSNVATVNINPSAPTNLVALTPTSTSIPMRWTNTQISPAPTGYQIESSPDGVTWAQAGTVGNVNTFTDTGLLPDSTRFYRVRTYMIGASGSYYFSGWSNTVSATTLP
ncbi:MAG: multicopper oxidase domain-containing protein [Anaerolineae bacterium]